MKRTQKVSKIDTEILRQIRAEVKSFQIRSISRIQIEGALILDIAPQVHDGVSVVCKPDQKVETLDIDNRYSPTYVGNICNQTPISENHFDAIFCTEVLEHVANPFKAILEIERILKPGGYLFATSPFGFRIHGPLPDNWRISEYGWNELLQNFEQVEIQSLEDPKRFLMPLHYSVTAIKKVS